MSELVHAGALHSLAHKVALVPLVVVLEEHLHAHFLKGACEIHIVDLLLGEEILIVGIVAGNVGERCRHIVVIGRSHCQELVV